MFISVSTASLNDFSKDIPETVKKEVNIDKVKIKIITLKKYLFIST